MLIISESTFLANIVVIPALTSALITLKDLQKAVCKHGHLLFL